MPSDNLILFEADIRLYGSCKLKDGRPGAAREKEEKEVEEW